MPNSHPYINRAIHQRLLDLFKHFSCVVLMGARQVGKSTVLKNLFPEIPCVVFDPVVDVENARADPELFLNNHPPPHIFDEVQYAPELIPVLKRQIDSEGKPGMYLLTGSQQWGVIKTVAESLAGRAIILTLEAFSLAEVSEQVVEKPWLERWLDNPEEFTRSSQKRLDLPLPLYEQLWRGFLPETHFLKKEFIPIFHGSYQRTYIERDIRLLAEISDLPLFGRFVKLAAALVAQEINYSQLGRDIGITPQTANRWLNILSQAFEWFTVPAFSGNAIKKVSGKPKGYFTDCGQVCHSQMISTPQAIGSHPLWGALFENAVVSELRKQCGMISTPPALYHWRVHSGAEVDLILERDGKLYPIEIKASTRPTRPDARGMVAFRKVHSHLAVQKGLVIAPSESMYPITENDYVIPWDLQ